MKITLAFDIFNKEATIERVLRSWLDSLSLFYEVEVIAVFDACKDSSDLVVAFTMEHYPDIGYRALFTDDVFEIRANNEALKHATGEIICFIQDDNFQHDAGWDDVLVKTYTRVETDPGLSHVGTVGLLAGVRMRPDFSMDRVECYRPHKDERGWVHGIRHDAYPLSVYRVDVVCRPFAVNTALLRLYGGLDEGYCPMDWDDAELSFRLLRDGFTNLYVPFDLLNLCAKKETLTPAQMNMNFRRGEFIARQRWGQFVAGRETNFKALMPLTEDDGRLSFQE